MTKSLKWAAAHTPHEDDLAQHWQPLREHLEAVAETAQHFAQYFTVPLAPELAYWSGILHDLGKYSQEFQDYLKAAYHADQTKTRSPNKKVDHSSAGAVLGRDLLLTGYKELVPTDGTGGEPP